MNEDKHIIWSNYDLDYEDWRGDLEAEYPELSEDERISLMYEINGHYLDDACDLSEYERGKIPGRGLYLRPSGTDGNASDPGGDAAEQKRDEAHRRPGTRSHGH